LPVEENFACIGLQQTDDVFEQHTFAATAFADDGCHLSLKNSQADSPEHLIGTEFFEDIA